MSADKTIKEEEPTGRRRRPSLSRSRAEEAEEDSVEERGITPGKGRATPSRRRQDDEEEDSNLATRTVGGLRGYFEGVRSELDKVVWPTREEIRRLTTIVLVTLVICALVLGTISFAFTELFRLGLNSPIILLVLMVLGIVAGFVILRASNGRSSSSY